MSSSELPHPTHPTHPTRRPRRVARHALALVALLLAIPAPRPALAAPPIDGVLEPGFYGAPRAVQDTPTAFGNATLGHRRISTSGSELDAAFAVIEGDTLYLMLTGNLETGTQGLDWPGGVPNRLDLFFDTIPGGQNGLRGDNVDVDGLNRMGYASPSDPGLHFDASFAADFWVSVLNFTEVVATPDPRHPQGEAWRARLYYATLPTGGGGDSLYLGQASDLLPNVHQDTFALRHGVRFGFDNRNTAGVTGTGDPGPNATDAPNVTRGIECAIPLSLLGGAGSLGAALRVCAFVNSPAHDYLSNQVLGPLTQPPGGYGNLGEARVTDFAAIPGDQFFTIPVPVSAVTEPTPAVSPLRVSPSPFAASTRITFDLRRAGRVTLTVHDVLGRRIARLLDEERAPGPLEVTWAGRDDGNRQVPAGKYWLRLSTPDETTSTTVHVQR